MSEFWTSFWSNFFSNIAVVAVLSVTGYIAKGPIVKSFKKFVETEIEDAVFAVQRQKATQKETGETKK